MCVGVVLPVWEHNSGGTVLYVFTHILLPLVHAELLHLKPLSLIHVEIVLAHGEPVWATGYTMVIDTDNTALSRHPIFWQSNLLTCFDWHWF